MTEKEVVAKLQELGLSQYESKCYISLLRENPANPYQISKRAGIPTAKIYEVVHRLEERGLIAACAGTDKGYAPKPPEVVFAQWRDTYLRRLSELSASLRALAVKPPVHVVWNVSGDAEVEAEGRRFIASAARAVHLYASPALLSCWHPELVAGLRRRVRLEIVCCGRPVADAAPLEPRVTNSPASSARGVTTVLATDGKLAMFVASPGTDSPMHATWTENPMLVRMAEDYVSEKVFVQDNLDNFRIMWGDQE